MHHGAVEEYVWQGRVSTFLFNGVAGLGALRVEKLMGQGRSIAASTVLTEALGLEPVT